MLGVIDNIVYNHPFVVVSFYVLLYVVFGIIDTIVYFKSISYAYKMVDGIFYVILTGSFEFTLRRYGLSYWTTIVWLLVAIMYAVSTPWAFNIKRGDRS